MSENTKLYAERDVEELDPHFYAHMSAMTGEGLHSKADIAAELAYRDKRIATLEQRLEAMRQCFIDNTLRTTPSAKGTDIGRQIDEAVDRVLQRMKEPK